jgi:hypothetical protein
MATIKLNVGGQIFETTKETLMFSDYFKSFLTNWSHDKEIFIDRSPRLFEHVLCLLRDPTYPYPNDYVGELDFYQIKHNIIRKDDLEQIIVDMKNEMSKTESRLNIAFAMLKKGHIPINFCSYDHCFKLTDLKHGECDYCKQHRKQRDYYGYLSLLRRELDGQLEKDFMNIKK